ncbi:MAG: hypothetical protein UY03_C0036G0003 [Parcubacteria group bacterium GW2011_GWA2_47_64]|nr:MAG: hypothetical protein UY03_C0036G0003 [Parcubacteria group bacterium GW2011_GWA2_47_64]
MLNLKFLKLSSVFFVLAFVLFSHNVSLAQERINARDSGMAILVENAEMKTGDGGIEIEAVLFNPSPSIETPLATYLLTLNNIDPLVKSKDLDYTPSPLIVSAQEGEDYFSLKPNERKTVNYFLPVSQYLPVANYAFNFRLMQKNGDIVGQRREILRNFGDNKKSSQVNYEKGFLAFFQESCVILNAKGQKFEPNEGPVFNSLEQPKVRCMVKNIGDEDIAVYPKIEWKEFFVYGRPSSGAKLEEKPGNSLIFKKGETKLVEVSLPSAEKSQVYQALLSFEDTNGDKRSFDMNFRWTIGGSSARVEEVSLLSPVKNIYQKGETMSLSVDYFGSMDLYWNNSSDDLAGLGGIKMLAAVKDKNGEVCGRKESDLPDISDSARKNQIIDVVLDKKCENASYAVSISSGDEQLAEETAEVPKTAESQTMKIYYYAGAVILLLAALIVIKRRKKAISSIAMLFFTFAAFGLFFNSADASATKTYTGSAYTGGYGGYATTNSAPMYSFYGVNDTSNVNKLVVKDVYADIDNDLNAFHTDIYYASGFTNCSNSTMQIRFRMYIEADKDLAKTRVRFAPKGSADGYQSQYVKESTSASFGSEEDYFDIDPSFLSNFYDKDKKLKTNPRLIIEIVQSGKSTHTNPYHRGDFSKPVSTVDFSSRSAAFDASDTIRYTIPLNLPAPSVSLTADPATSAPPNDNVKVKLDTTDMSVCKFFNSKNYPGTSAFDGLTFDTPLEKGSLSQTKTVSRAWSPSVSTASQKNDLQMDCTRDLGQYIGKGSYLAKAAATVNSPNYKISIGKSPFSTGTGTVKASFSWPTVITANTGNKITAVTSAIKNIFNRAEAFSRDSSKYLAVSADITCTTFPCSPIYVPEGAGVTLTAIPDGGSSFGSWDIMTPASCTGGASSNPCNFTMPAKDQVVGVKLVSSESCSLTINKDTTGGNGSVNVVRSAGGSFVCNLQSGLSSCNSNNESAGDTLTLTPNPSGATWPVCSSVSNGICTVNLPSSGACSKSVTVKFPAGSNPPPPVGGGYSLTVNFGGNGSGIITNLKESDATSGGKTWNNYPNNTKIKLQATANTGSRFGGWNKTLNMGNCTNSSGSSGTISKTDIDNDTCEITLDGSSKTTTVTFDQSSVSSDPGTFNLTVAQKGDGTGSVSLMHMGSLDGNDGGLDSNVGGSSPWGLAKDWKFQITATPDSGSSLGSVSGGGCGGSPCAITMNSNKTVTVTFNKDTSGCCGGGAVTASITARENPVLDGYTVIDWGSTNASSCSQKDGGDDSAGWKKAADITSGSYDTIEPFTLSEGARTYTITCTNGGQSASASVDIEAGGDFGDGSVSLWADESPIKYKGTTKILWSSSNIVSSECTLFSANDSMTNPYLAYFSSGAFGSGYYAQVAKNNTDGKTTGNLTGDTVYQIRCRAKDNAYVADQTTVTVSPQVSNFTFSVSAGAPLLATIVEGLSANSSVADLTLSGETIGNVNLSAKIPAILSGAKAQFSKDGGKSWAETLDVDASAASPQAKIKVIDIPGATATGTYNQIKNLLES